MATEVVFNAIHDSAKDIANMLNVIIKDENRAEKRQLVISTAGTMLRQIEDVIDNVVKLKKLSNFSKAVFVAYVNEAGEVQEVKPTDLDDVFKLSKGNLEVFKA